MAAPAAFRRGFNRWRSSNSNTQPRVCVDLMVASAGDWLAPVGMLPRAWGKPPHAEAVPQSVKMSHYSVKRPNDFDTPETAMLHCVEGYGS